MAANRKQAMVPAGADDPRPRRHRARRRRAGHADGRRAARPAARAAADVAHRGADRRGAGGDRGPHRVPPGHLRMFGLPESGLAETLREAERSSTASTAWRSPPACDAASSRSSRATNPTPPRRTGSWSMCCANAMRARSSPPTARWSTTRSRRCWPAAASRRRSRARRAWSRRDSQTHTARSATTPSFTAARSATARSSAWAPRC